MSIQSNFPALKPTLLLDFANVKQLDPRITFTRASEGRYYNGVTTAKAEENLLLRSQDYSATWTVTNLTPVTGKTAPDSTSTATEFTAGAANAVLTQSYTAIAGSYTFSVWLRRVTGTGDIQIAADNGTWTTKTITSTWARYDVTQTVTAGSKTAGVQVVTSGDAIEVWGAQLEQRAAMTAYTATTTQPITNYIPVLMTAPAGVARFDHSPTTGESLGLLIEEQRTNLLTYSEQFDDAAWTKTTDVTVTANANIAPSGNLVADSLTESTGSTSKRVLQTATTAASTIHTLSVYAKPISGSEQRYLMLSFSSAASATTYAQVRFDLVTGQSVLTAANGTGFAITSSSITSVGNGWYRCVAVGTIGTNTGMTANIGITQSATTISPGVRGSQNYTGDGYSGIYIWGAQLESGEFSTSYIPTVAAQVTRSADAASMTGTNFTSWFSNDQGTLYAEAAFAGLTTSSRILQLDDGSASNFISLQTNPSTATSSQLRAFVSGTNTVFANVNNAYAANVYAKTAAAYAVDNFAITVNASAVSTDLTSPVPTLNTLRLGASSTAISNVTIRKIAYYPIRCTDAQLQALTS